MSDGNALLELQRLDLQADALRAEHTNLPERRAIADIDVALAGAADERTTREARSRELSDQERQLESEAAGLRAEAAQVESDLYGGKVTALSELEGLQTKLASLKTAEGEIEERQMALLEEQEADDSALSELAEKVAELATQRAAHVESLAAAEGVIDAKIGRVAEARGTVEPNVPAARLGEYQKLRGIDRLGGRAASQLEGDSCVACRVKLPIMDARRVREAGADTVVTCQSCQRILVV